MKLWISPFGTRRFEMAGRTLITAALTVVPQVGSPQAGSRTLPTPQSSDDVNGNYFPFPQTGSVYLLAVNGTGAQTITITGKPDKFNRTAVITEYSVPSNGKALFGPFPADVWNNSTEETGLFISTSASTLALVVLIGT
jgi:hypothetical protein